MASQSQLSFLIEGIENQGVRSFLDALGKTFPEQIYQVILFGSRARNDSLAGSDTDLLVLVKDETWDLRHAIWNLAYDVEMEYDSLLFNIQVISLERWKLMNSAGFSLCKNVALDGIVLYDREL